MISVPIKKANIDYDYTELDGFKLSIEVGAGYTHSANTIKKMIDSGMELELQIKKPTEDKSRKQLATAWLAMREIADAISVPLDEVYRMMLTRYGKSTVMMVPASEADRIIELHTDVSNGNFGEVMGRSKQDKSCMVIKLWWGLSSYNKDEMSAFLDGLVSEHEDIFGP